MVIGSSGLPSILISCTIALPIEVTRSESCACLPSTSGSGGVVVTVPCHDPASVLSTAKDFSPFDWAKPAAESHIRRTGSTKRSDLIGYLLCFSIGRGALVLLVSGLRGDHPVFLLLIYLTITVCHM